MDDVDPFMLAVNNPLEYEKQYGIDPLVNGDINRDGVVDFFDLDSFIAIIT